MNQSENAGCAEEKAGKSTASPAPEDTDFEPTAEMMIHDFDDETTLNDDEDDIETNEEELADLAKEGEMPLEELMAMYYGGGGDAEEQPSQNEENESDNQEDTSDEAPRRTLRSTGLSNPAASGSESSDDEDNNATIPEEERKKPRLGEEFQVTEIPNVVPENKRNNEKYDHEDDQVWTPGKLPEETIEEYLKEIAMASTTNSDVDSASFIQDNEDALFLLTQVDNDPEEALKRYKARPLPLNNEVQVWSEEECREFENGLTVYGKDFFLIHMNKVRTKSVRDIVKFYYVWKKSERYDHFTAKTRLGKKKELLPASVTDYMDRLLDETDHATTSSILNNTSAHFLKYSLAAHSAALMEHLRELESSHLSDRDHNFDGILLGAGDGQQRDVHLGNSTGASTSNVYKEIKINANRNNNNSDDDDNLQEHVVGHVIRDFVENSSSIG